MSTAAAVFTSDPNLLRCVLHRLNGQVLLSSPEPLSTGGVGSYAPEDVLLQRFSQGTLPGTVEELRPKESSEALLYVAEALSPGMSMESAQPLRSRPWLFGLGGEMEGLAAFKGRLLAEVPPFIQWRLGSQSLAEVTFALFLKYLHELGRAEDPSLEPAVAAGLLGRAARRIQDLAAEVGVRRAGTLHLLATNQRMLLAARLGEQPLHYLLLEGSDRCPVCGLVAATVATEAKIRAHLRQRTVAVASRVSSPAGWLEVNSGSALAVGWDLNLRVLDF